MLLPDPGLAGTEQGLPASLALEEAQASFDKARRLLEAGQYGDGMVAAERARKMRESRLGAGHPAVAACLGLLGELNWRLGRLEQAQSFLEQAVSIQETALGKAHPELGKSLLALANVHLARTSYLKARVSFERALSILEAVPGGGREVARGILELAQRHQAQGDYEQAQRLRIRARQIVRSTPWSAAGVPGQAAPGAGVEELRSADCLEHLGTVHAGKGEHVRAQQLLARALEIREAVLGPSHPDVAVTLTNLGNAYRKLGMSTRAEDLHARAIAIGESTLGRDSPVVAGRLNNLAVLYTDQELFARSRPLYDRALEIVEEVRGRDDPSVAYVLNNLGVDYIKQGFYALAEPLLARALRIREAKLGGDHPLVADVLNNLSAVHAYQGQYERAEAASLRALDITERALGRDHPDVVTRLTNLGYLYRVQGQRDRARSILLRARAMAEAAPERAPLAMVLSSLARLLIEEGEHEQAGALARQARLACRPDDTSCNGQVLEIMARLYAVQGAWSRSQELVSQVMQSLDPAAAATHPEAARLLFTLGELKLAEGRMKEALPLLRRAFSISEGRLRREALGLSGARLASFLQLLRQDEERMYSLVRLYPESRDVRLLGLAAALLLKGRSVEETADTSRAIYRSLDAEDRETFDRLRGLRTQLARLSLDGAGELPLPVYQQRLQELTQQGDALEAELAQRSAPLRALTSLPSVDQIVSRVTSALGSWEWGRWRDAGLVEIVAYTDHPPVPGPWASTSPGTGQLRYLALLLLADGRTQAIDLGPAGPIDAAAVRLRDALASRDASFMRTARELHSLVFRPLVPFLDGIRRLYVAPDGQLGLIPFEVLHDGSRFLVDAYTFTYLTSGKDLLPPPDDVPTKHSVVVFAAPDFGTTPDSGAAGTVVASADRSYSVQQFFATRRGFDGQSWLPLPGTRKEAEMLRSFFPQARMFLGRDASKARLLSLRTPGLLHIATHGFFLEDAASARDARGIAVSGSLGGDLLAVGLPDPLLRSGLVLAGAGSVSAAPESRRHLDESLVTALELAGIDLWGTQLVVLSACDTGRGEVKLGQGIYGLRRALVVAGAETVVMSLWKVNDETTNSFMEKLYRNLVEGKRRSEALRQAMLSMRAEHRHPYYWAPFIALGRDTPLRGLGPPR